MGTVLAAAGLMVAVVGGLSAPALAHEAEKSVKATVLVRQAIAYMVEVPMRPEMWQDKTNDALNSSDQSGVYVVYVKQALAAEKAGDVHHARALLEASIGAKTHMSGVDPAPILHLSGQSAVGAEPGVGVASEPLELGAQFTGLNVALLAASGLAILLGAVMATRLRPRHHRQQATT